MKIEMLDVTDVREYEGNPREIPESAVDAVADSIREFGFKNPVIVDADNVLVAGHTRVRAARKLGMTQVPAIRADDLTPEQVRAFRIADNKLHELAGWDYELLPIELGELKDAGVDLDLLGFGDELGRLLDSTGPKQGLTDPDHVPEPPDEPVTQPGDLWILGEHRLLCGDAGNAENVDRLLDGATIQLVNTDPPYNVRVEPRSSTAIAAGISSFSPDPYGRKKKGLMHHQAFDVARGVVDPSKARAKMRAKDRPLEGDFMSDEEFAALLRMWFGQIARVLDPGRSFYIWGGYSNIGNMPAALADSGLYFSQAIIWVKGHPVMCRKDFMGNHEWCFYGWREGVRHQFFGPPNVPDVWEVKKIAPQKMVHLTEKPVELARRAIEYSSRPGENVFDPFAGSGSTLIACEQMGRRCFLMEIDALYCDVIVRRWEEFTGRKAEREPKSTPAEVTGAEGER